MWKRDDAVKPPTGPGQGAPAGEPPAAARAAEPKRQLGDTVNIGKSVVIKGELNGSEDLTIEGQVDGKIELRQNVLTIGPNGKIKAQIFAKAVVVLGEVTGNVTATEKVDIRDNGSVDGDLVAPRVAIADGAHFRGSIDMQRTPGAASTGAKPAETKPEAKPESKPVVASGPSSPQVPQR
jgi:cytoskeletal protein CcmA (bactofilin family)